MICLFSSGSNARGQLANGSVEDSHIFTQCTFEGIGVELPSGTKILSVVTGANHTLVLLRNPDGISQLWGCGDNQKGQLGSKALSQSQSLSSSSNSNNPHLSNPSSFIFLRLRLDQIVSRYGAAVGQIKMIGAAWETSFVVISYQDEDKLFSAGGGDFGDLGVGELSKKLKEVRDWKPIELRRLLPKGASGIRFLDLKSGPHTIIVKIQYEEGGKQHCMLSGWGAARHGQLSRLGLPSSQKLPNFISVPKAIDMLEEIDEIAIGNQHTVFLTSHGNVLSLGSNKKGQIDGIKSLRDVCAVRTTWNGTYLVQGRLKERGNWSIWSAGGSRVPPTQLQSSRSSSGNTTASTSSREVFFPDSVKRKALLSLVCGSEHVLVHVSEGEMSEVYGWGWNEHGNLGLGNTNDVQEPTRIWPAADGIESGGGQVVGVWAGCATTWLAVERT
jgi:protein ATS1